MKVQTFFNDRFLDEIFRLEELQIECCENFEQKLIRHLVQTVQKAL